ncbi:hypothetical protein BDZ89DRAFT_960224 [Hymenopellis radicata]|nr:hypothetical protein BDZ89DRAFT_960224 [Hymenopellis radicata]
MRLIRYVPGSRPVVDQKRRMIALIAGKPRDEEKWTAVEKGIVEAIDKGCRGVTFSKKLSEHKRGRFPAPAIGISHGGGELAPGNRALSGAVKDFMRGLLRDPSFIRLAGWVGRTFETHNRPMHTAYVSTLDTLTAALPHLRRNFSNNPFACMTVNCGGRVVCEPHGDFANKPDGWCAVTPFGPFDHTKGGHIVLWDLKLVIELPAGCTIYLPSALIIHSNIRIRKGERRYSVTHYSAGGLFRWVYNGGRTDEEFWATASEEEKEKWIEDRERRWHEGLKYFPIV